MVTEADFEAAASNLDGYLVVGTTEQFDETLLVLAYVICAGRSATSFTDRERHSVASRAI